MENYRINISIKKTAIKYVASNFKHGSPIYYATICIQNIRTRWNWIQIMESQFKSEAFKIYKFLEKDRMSID